MKQFLNNIYIISIFIILSCSKNSSPLILVENNDINEDEIRSMSWDTQSWMMNGTSYKMEIENDGNSELSIRFPFEMDADEKNSFQKLNWEIYEEYRNSNILSTTITIKKYYNTSTAINMFNTLISEGILDLKPIEANYCDGAGTVVGIKTFYLFREVTIAHLAYDENSKQYAIFNKCRNIINVDEIYKYIQDNVYPIFREQNELSPNPSIVRTVP